MAGGVERERERKKDKLDPCGTTPLGRLANGQRKVRELCSNCYANRAEIANNNNTSNKQQQCLVSRIGIEQLATTKTVQIQIELVAAEVIMATSRTFPGPEPPKLEPA